MFIHQEYVSKKYSKNIPSVRIFQYKISSQQEYSSAKYSVGRNILVQNIQTVGEYSSAKYSLGRNIAIQNIHSAGIFQFKIFIQWEYSGTKTFIP
jgi:hypothetical protein